MNLSITFPWLRGNITEVVAISFAFKFLHSGYLQSTSTAATAPTHLAGGVRNVWYKVRKPAQCGQKPRRSVPIVPEWCRHYRSRHNPSKDEPLLRKWRIRGGQEAHRPDRRQIDGRGNRSTLRPRNQSIWLVWDSLLALDRVLHLKRLCETLSNLAFFSTIFVNDATMEMSCV